jgi:hypothetical protein
VITFRALGGVLLLCLALYRPILAFFEPALVFIEPALACIDTLLARIGPDVSMIYALLKGGKKSVVLKLYQKQVMSVIYPTVNFVRNNLMLTPLVGGCAGYCSKSDNKKQINLEKREMHYEQPRPHYEANKAC